MCTYISCHWNTKPETRKRLESDFWGGSPDGNSKLLTIIYNVTIESHFFDIYSAQTEAPTKIKCHSLMPRQQRAFHLPSGGNRYTRLHPNLANLRPCLCAAADAVLIHVHVLISLWPMAGCIDDSLIHLQRYTMWVNQNILPTWNKAKWEWLWMIRLTNHDSSEVTVRWL